MQIVQTNVSLQQAAIPNKLQQKGCFVSVGGTNLAAGTTATVVSAASFSALAPSAELQAKYNSFTANNKGSIAFDILELGAVVGTAAKITAISAYVAANPKKYYSYLLPDGLQADATLAPFLSLHSAQNEMVYFYFASDATVAVNFAGIKSARQSINSLTAATTENIAAAWMAVELNYNPSVSNKKTQAEFAFLFGVTQYALTGTNDVDFKTWNLAYAGSGAEGGISNTILRNAKGCDSKPTGYWYAVDWAQIETNQAIANAIINGSNMQPPLSYDNQGINALRDVAQSRGDAGIAFNLLLQCTVTAVDFVTYTTQNPTHRPLGVYNGLQCRAVPQGGFEAIVFNLTVSDFVA